MHLTKDRDISIDLSCFLMKISGIWLAANKQEQTYRTIALTYTFVTLSFGIYVDVADIYNTWGDFGNCVYMACNILCIGMALFKILVLFIYKIEFVDLVLYAQRNFWHSNYDPHEKSLVTECRKFFTVCIVFTYFVTQAICANYMLTPVIANLGRNKSDRVLPFNMWVNLPLSVSPYYEIMFVIQILCVYQIRVCYVCIDNFLCLINMHLTCQFRILQYRMTNLWRSTDKQTDVVDHKDSHNAMLRKCIRQHQALIKYCRKLENVFTTVILGHLLVFSVLMCLVGYQIFLAESTTTRRLIFIFHITGSFFQIVLFTYSCDGLIEESTNIGMAVYSGPWTVLPMDKTGKSFRDNMKLIILKSRQPCYLSAGGFFPVCLETSTTVLSTAMSYFTLLRESSMRVQ